MKKLLLLPIMLMTLGFSFAQESSQHKSNFDKFCIQHAVEVVEIVSEKEGQLTIDGEIEIGDLNNLNYKKLKIELIEERSRYYKVKGSDTVIVVRSLRDLRNRYQGQK